MNTCDPGMARNRAGATVSFRARGCVLLEDPGGTAEATAKKEAADLKEKLERERIRREAEAAAEQRMRTEIEAIRREQSRLWTRLNEEFAKTLKQLESDIQRQLIEMTVRTTEILLCHELPDADMVRSIMTEVLSPISDLQGVRVRVARDTLHLLTGDPASPPLHPGIECVEDPELKPGDVVVESRNGIFDGRLKLRLDQLAEALAQPPVDESSEE